MRHRQQGLVAELAFSVATTGLPNRSPLRGRLQRLTADAPRPEFRWFLTVLDVDCFEIDSMLATRRGMSGKSKETARDSLAVAVRAADPEEARWPTRAIPRT